MGSSKLPGRFTCPLTQKSFVPGLFSVPHCRYHSPPFRTMCGTRRERLHIVDRGGPSEGPRRCREGWLDARESPIALERAHEGRLLPADVRARALVDGELDGDAGSEDVLARETCLVRLLHGTGEDLVRLEELAAAVDIDVIGLDRVRGDEATLDQLMRRPAKDLPVLEGAWFRFVRVAAQVMGSRLLLRHEGPLEPCGETCPPSTPEARGLHGLDDGFPAEFERPGEAFIPAERPPSPDSARPRVAPPPTQEADLLLVRVRVCHATRLPFSAARGSGARRRR